MKTFQYFTVLLFIGISLRSVASEDNLDSNIFEPAYEVNGKPIYDLKDGPKLFMEYVRVYERTYEDLYDIVIHYDMFRQTLEEINKANKNPDNLWTAGIGPMADVIISDGPGYVLFYCTLATPS